MRLSFLFVTHYSTAGGRMQALPPTKNTVFPMTGFKIFSISPLLQHKSLRSVTEYQVSFWLLIPSMPGNSHHHGRHLLRLRKHDQTSVFQRHTIKGFLPISLEKFKGIQPRTFRRPCKGICFLASLHHDQLIPGAVVCCRINLGKGVKLRLVDAFQNQLLCSWSSIS